MPVRDAMTGKQMSKEPSMRVKNLLGQRFGKLVVVEYAGTVHGAAQWRVKCDCGECLVVKSNSLIGGGSRSCGCSRRADLAGKRFGRLVAKRLSDVRGADGKPRWECECDCGATCVVSSAHLLDGSTKACGCLVGENLRAAKKHGLSRTPEYFIWFSMVSRCHNKRNASYPNYGGRGIKVCDRWRESFENFLADMGARPGPKLSIDRIDNDGDYCPENCRWATALEQAANTRRAKLVECNGEMMPVMRAVRTIGVVSYSCCAWRLEHGWDQRAAMMTPSSRRRVEVSE